jgi:hypothetical protein
VKIARNAIFDPKKADVYNAANIPGKKVSQGSYLAEIEIFLNDFDPNAARLELYADGINGSAPFRQEMKGVRQLADVSGGYVYSAAK